MNWFAKTDSSNSVAPLRSGKEEIDDVTIGHAASKGLPVYNEEKYGLEPIEQMKQLELIRMMPISIPQKRKLRKLVESRTTTIRRGQCGTGCYSCRLKCYRNCLTCSVKWRYINVTLLRKVLKNVDGRFGYRALSYFKLLKTLVNLNLFTLIIFLLFLVLPMIIFASSDGYSSNVTGGADTENADFCTRGYVVEYSNNSVQDDIMDVLLGTGRLEKSVLFHGYYEATEQVLSGLKDFKFNIPLSYVLLTIIYFVISLIVIVRLSIAGFENRIFVSKRDSPEFCITVFTGWDFSITDARTEAALHTKFYTHLKEMRMALRRKRIWARSTSCQLVELWFIRVTINFVVALFLAAAGYIIFFVTTTQLERVSLQSYDSKSSMNKLLIRYMTALTMAGLNFFLPLLFLLLVRFEQYEPLTAHVMNLLRKVLLQLLMFGTFLLGHRDSITCSEKTSDCKIGTNSCPPLYCWETYVGQEMYKLVIVNFFQVILGTLCIQVPRYFIVKKSDSKLVQKLGYKEFIAAEEFVDVIYLQILMWFGCFFCPLLPGMVLVIMLTIFAFKYVCVMKLYTFPMVSLSMAGTDKFFMYYVLLAYTMAVVPLTYVIYSLEPSLSCGPFRIYSEMYNILPITEDHFPDGIKTIFKLFHSAATWVAIFIILCLSLHYTRLTNAAFRKMLDRYAESVLKEGQQRSTLVRQMKVLEAGGTLGKGNIPMKRKMTLKDVTQKLLAKKREGGEFPVMAPPLATPTTVVPIVNRGRNEKRHLSIKRFPPNHCDRYETEGWFIWEDEEVPRVIP